MYRVVIYFLFVIFFIYGYSVDLSSSQENNYSSDLTQTVDDVTMQYGESLNENKINQIKTYTYDDLINSQLNISYLKYKSFNGFRVNEIFSHAMLNPLKRTGHPLFMMQARKDGLLEDGYIYTGGKTAFIDWNRLHAIHNQGATKDFSYFIDGYIASTLSKWISAFGSLTVYNDGAGTHVIPYSWYVTVGDLSESNIFGYVANDVVMFGNFDIVSNYVSTLTRLYFMQSGGNANLSYATDSILLNAVILNSNTKGYFGTTNADSKGGIGYTLNAKYTYKMSTEGNYQYFGIAYTNSSGFNSTTNGRVGVFDAHYVAAISDFNFFVEGAVTDKGVSGVNYSSAISSNKISGVPFFGSIRPDSQYIYDNFLNSGGVVGSWSIQGSYTWNLFEKSFITYLDYSQLYQNTNNNALQYGGGFRYNLLYSSWLGLDYTSITTKSTEYKSSQNYLSVSYVIYV